MGAVRLLSVLLGGALIGLLSSHLIPYTRWSQSSAHSPWKHTLAVEAATYSFSNTSHSSKVAIVSIDPLVIYIQDFVSTDESASLMALVDGHFRPSEIWSNDGTEGTVVPEIRDSMWASPNSSEPVVQAIEARAKTFQGFGNVGDVEPLKVLRYELGGHYEHHHDSFPEEVAQHSMEGNRQSTFFVYLDADCTGGGTNFPRLVRPRGDEWCQFIDCDEPPEDGVTFKPIAGNAIFWYNLMANGRTPHPDLLHAGLPVRTGRKIGLNIWSWTPFTDAVH